MNSNTVNVLFMIKIKLSDYLAQPGNTQADLARRVGLTQGAISHMVIHQRPVWVVMENDEVVALEEVKIRRASAA
jgi:predicted transcriptional regulator